MPEQELITRGQADTFFLVIGIVGVLVAGGAWFVARRLRRPPLALALLWGGPLVLVGALWRVYNAITDRLGLDRVINLWTNLLLFVVVGVVCGGGYALLANRSENVEIKRQTD